MLRWQNLTPTGPTVQTNSTLSHCIHTIVSSPLAQRTAEIIILSVCYYSLGYNLGQGVTLPVDDPVRVILCRRGLLQALPWISAILR